MSSVIDTSFNTGTPVGLNSTVQTQSIQNDGKIILGGWFVTYKWVIVNRIVRLNIDGTIDFNFHTGNGFNNNVNAIAIQNDGKILVGGSFQTYSWVSVNRIVRLNIDGTLDQTFTGILVGINTIAIQNDGKILVGMSSSNFIVRLNSDGSIDNSFIFTGTLLTHRSTRYVNTIAIQNDGKILVGGSFEWYNGTPTKHVLRLNSDGTLDTGFDTRNWFNSISWPVIYNIKIQNDGKVLVGGSFQTYSWAASKNFARLNSDGTLDTGLNVWWWFLGYVRTVQIQNDGKILVGGDFPIYNGITVNQITRLNSDGSIDNFFHTGNGFDGGIYNIIIGANGSIFIGGDFLAYDWLAVNREIMLDTDGAVNWNFDIWNWFNSNISTSVAQNDGKLLIAWGFLSYMGNKNIRYITRLNNDWSIDNTFNQRTWDYPWIKKIFLQDNWKIILWGNPIIRLNSDGSIDNSLAAKPVNFVDMILQSDGKMILWGDFWTYSGVTVNGIVRLNTDGSIDTGFNTWAGFKDNNSWNMWKVAALAVQDDGKVVVGGDFDWYKGTANLKKIIRLNSDGSIDGGFNVWAGFDSSVKTIKMQSDGKILIGWLFTTYKGVAVKSLIRLNSDWSLDTWFVLWDTFTNTVENIIITTWGIIVCGSDGGNWFNQFAYITNSGNIDTWLNLGAIGIKTAAVMPNGKIAIGGIFTNYNGIPAWYLTMLYWNALVVDLPNSTDTTTINNAFKVRGYTEDSDGKLLGSTPISLVNTNGNIPIDLTIQNTNITVILNANTQIKKTIDNTNYNGLLSVPIFKNINSVNNLSVISSFNIGSTSESINLVWWVVSLSIPVPTQTIWQSIQVYYSQDNGITWYPETLTSVINKFWIPTVEFTTNKLTNFALTQWPDTIPPTASISYSSTGPTNQDVIATVTGFSESITGLNTTSYTFTGNWSFTFNFQDLAGNTWSAIATVSNIDKVAPTASVSYNISSTTNQDVIATLTGFSESVTWLNALNYIFTGNGSFTFTFQDIAGNTWSAIATVNWITASNWGGSNGGWGSSNIIITPVTTTTKPSPSILNSRYPTETNTAYVWAYNAGITTQPSIQSANIDGKLIRKDMAKMITNFAINVLKKPLNTWANCTFSDITTQSKEAQTYATAACQLGLMGYDSNGKTVKSTFNPNAEVDRAQFGTILSRLLYGDKYNGGKTYYTNHLDALKNAWVMSKIDTPTQKELRGYVMLMMMRAAK